MHELLHNKLTRNFRTVRKVKITCAITNFVRNKVTNTRLLVVIIMIVIMLMIMIIVSLTTVKVILSVIIVIIKITTLKECKQIFLKIESDKFLHFLMQLKIQT